MIKLFKVLILYAIYGLIIGELVVRMLYLTSDIPQRTITSDHIQKYIPNQSGYWSGGEHKWQINERGWAGTLPSNYDNLFTIIGDSFIENFMNPDECHQSYYLKKQLPKLNFLEAGRSGVSFIEALEISKHLDSLNPKYHIIYLGDPDLEESLINISIKSDITQFDIEKQTLKYGKLKSPFAKKILYNWKFMYYLYNRFPINFNKTKTSEIKVVSKPISGAEKHEASFKQLLEFIKDNYNIENKILVLKPVASEKLGQLLKSYGFKIVVLDNNNEEWTFVYDDHWTCYGHDEASKQIAKVLKGLNL